MFTKQLDIDTPALVVDLDVMSRNISNFANTCATAGKNWRPHFKSLRCVEIARQAIDAGAIGLTCATIDEAEFLISHKIDNVLIANQIIGERKLRRLAELSRNAKIAVSVDSAQVCKMTASMAEQTGTRIDVAIEMDIGLNRAGITAVSDVVELAHEISRLRSLRLVGIMGWEGHAAALADLSEKRLAVLGATDLLGRSADALRGNGYLMEFVSAGGTGTFQYALQSSSLTEIQAGGIILGDALQEKVYKTEFPPAAFLMSTVTSRPASNRAVCDTGFKTLGDEFYSPYVVTENLSSSCTISMSADHCVIESPIPFDLPKVGDHIWFGLGYSDSTVFKHRKLYAVKNSQLVAIWLLQ